MLSHLKTYRSPACFFKAAGRRQEAPERLAGLWTTTAEVDRIAFPVAVCGIYGPRLPVPMLVVSGASFSLFAF